MARPVIAALTNISKPSPIPPPCGAMASNAPAATQSQWMTRPNLSNRRGFSFDLVGQIIERKASSIFTPYRKTVISERALPCLR